MSEATSHACHYCAAEQAKKEETDFILSYIMAVISGILLAFGVLSEFFLDINEEIVLVIFVLSIMISGRNIIPKGIRGAANLHLDINFLMTSAAIGGVLIGAPAEGAAVMFLFFIAELLEEKAGDRVRSEIQSLVELEPPTVEVKGDEGEYYTSPDDVEVGQVIIVRPGERIGLDGIIVYGSSSINQSHITGESIPIQKQVDDEVYAGSINISGYLEIEVTKLSKDSVLSKIISLIEEARNKRAPTEKLVSRFSHVYTPLIVVASFLLGLVTLILGAPINQAIYRGLTLLVTSCPCAFAISIPVSMVASITGAARDGVLIKGSTYIEKMSNIRTIAFDKTGTLTQGELEVVEICKHNEVSAERILTIAASLERLSEHPIAKAIVSKAESANLTLLIPEDFISVPGRGIEGSLNDSKFIVGNHRFLMEKGIDLKFDESHKCGIGTLIYVVENKTHLGTLVLADTIRPESIETISKLKERGIRTVMLTGDHDLTAQEIARQLEIDEFQAELLPGQKVEEIEKLKQLGPIMMIGDGVNDAPAIAAADIGAAMGVFGSDTTIETSDVALMKDDISRLPRLLTRAKQTMSVVKQNIGISIGVKLIIAVLAILGIVSLWMAILFGDMGITFVVIANALRLARKQ
ncbi:MAG: cadmium-translocating P-type ATPase [Candidatus Lokiarchaeota archaeon]|nr:cadmium-translocating P-type ATPase [Candidatus Lokiarchaeota archaeon]